MTISGETGDLIETTREDIAKEHECIRKVETILQWSRGRTGNLIAGFEAALKDAKVGKEVEVEIAPADATGKKTQRRLRQSVSISCKICSRPKFTISRRRHNRWPSRILSYLQLEEQELTIITQWLVKL